MAGWWLYLLFPLACFLPGFLGLALISGREAAEERSFSAFLFRRVVAGFLFHSAVVLLLAELGLLTLGWFLAIDGGLALLLLAAATWRGRPGLAVPRPRWEDLVSLLVLLLATVSFGRPQMVIPGGTDAGSYISIAAGITHEGGLRFQDPVWAGVDPQLAREDFLFANMPGLRMAYHRLPGFYAVDAASGTIVPQFYYLYPLWLALGFLVAGFPGGLFMTPILAAWGVVALYQAGRLVLGRRPALLGAIFLCINPLSIWMGRYAVSEILSQFLLFSAFYGLVAFLTTAGEDRAGGVLAGAALGGLVHTRVDAILGVVLVGLWLLYLALARPRRVSWKPLLIPLGISFVHWAFYVYFFVLGYTMDSLRGGFYFPFAWITLSLSILGTAGFALLVVLTRRGVLQRWLPALRVAAAVAVGLLALFAYFVWPRLNPTREIALYDWTGWIPVTISQGQNFVQVGWYLTPLGLALGVLGFAVAIVKVDWRRVVCPAGLALFYGILYLYESFLHPMHPPVMRHHMFVLFPTLVLMAGYLLHRLARLHPWKTAVVALGLLLFWGVSLLFIAAPVWGEVDMTGLEGQLAALAGRFSPRDILLFSDLHPGVELSVPLQYIYQRSSWVLQRPQPDRAALQAQVQTWWQEGRQVYVLVGSGSSRLSPADFRYERQDTAEIQWHQLEYSMDHLPQQVWIGMYRLNLYRLAEPGGAAFRRVVDVGTDDYPYLAEGFWDNEQTPTGETFRWTRDEATVELPAVWFDSRPLTLTLTMVQNWATPEQESWVEVWLGGTLLQRLTPAPGFQDYSFSIPAGLPREQGVVVLRLHSTTWSPSAAGQQDSRLLGVAVDRIVLQSPGRGP